MKKAYTKTSSSKRLKISDSTRQAFERRDKKRDTRGPDEPVRPPEFWQDAAIGKYYRPRKTLISLRIDNEILDWLKSKGEGHLTRINQMLRERMSVELTRSA